MKLPVKCTLCQRYLFTALDLVFHKSLSSEEQLQQQQLLNVFGVSALEGKQEEEEDGEDGARVNVSEPAAMLVDDVSRDDGLELPLAPEVVIQVKGEMVDKYDEMIEVVENGGSADQAQRFSCDTCGKSFKSNSKLAVHLLTHTGAKPHECDVCGMRFRLRHHLKDHKLRHVGQRKFNCSTCGRAFNILNDLQQHIRRVHLLKRRRKSYNCDQCLKVFFSKVNYDEHQLSCTGTATSSGNTCSTLSKKSDRPSSAGVKSRKKRR